MEETDSKEDESSILEQLKQSGANSITNLFNRLNTQEAINLVKSGQNITRNRKNKRDKLEALDKVNKMLYNVHNTSSSFTNNTNDYSPELNIHSLYNHLTAREVNTLYRAARSSLTGVRSKSLAQQALNDLSDINTELIDLYNIANDE